MNVASPVIPDVHNIDTEDFTFVSSVSDSINDVVMYTSSTALEEEPRLCGHSRKFFARRFPARWRCLSSEDICSHRQSSAGSTLDTGDTSRYPHNNVLQLAYTPPDTAVRTREGKLQER